MAKLPKSYIKKYGITKKAWRLFKASKKKKSKSSTKKKSNPKNKGGRKMAGFNVTSLFKYLRLGSLIAPALLKYKDMVNKQWSQEKAIVNAITQYGGFGADGNGQMAFNAKNLANAWLPYLVTNLVTHGIPKLNGIIRRL